MMRRPFFWPIDLELLGMDNGRFDSKDVAILIVHLDGVAVNGMAQTNSFRSLLEAGGHLTFKICGNFASALIDLFAQKAQDVRTLKTLDSVPQEMRVKPWQAWGMGIVKNNIGGEFSLRGAPVVA